MHISIKANAFVRGLRVTVDNTSLTTPIHALGGHMEGLGPVELVGTLGPGERHVTRFDFLSMRPMPTLEVPAPGTEDEWHLDQLAKVTISFDLNGRRWVKRGLEPVELAS